ncbi:MAG: hypothetical protein E7020_05580 [Alphaproteobacteria bacterium]|nr:hypothetical protein [Alphaproteobacteria bacterium]
MEKMIVNLQDINTDNIPNFSDYEEFKNGFGFELENRQFIHTYLPPEIKSRNEALSSAIGFMPPEHLRMKADELLQNQKIAGKYDDLINLMASKSNNNYNQFSSMWSPLIWQAREDNSRQQVEISTKNGKKNIDAFDMDYLIAENLQHLYSSEDPAAEYYDWCERQQKIEIDINTGGTTEDEIVARDTFINFLDDRETEIKRVMQLYAGAAFNTNCRMQESAQEKLKFLTFKLSELRRLRQRTETTKSRADSKEYFEQKERRQQQIATSATAGIVAMEALSLGDKRLAEQAFNASIEHGLGETFVNMRPETQTIEQANNKIKSAYRNRAQMEAMVAALRNGKTVEQWKNENQNTNTHNSSTVRNNVRNLRGWEITKFREATNTMSA